MAAKSERQLVSVMFTDIEGYSAVTQRDEALALSFVSRYRRAVTECTANHDGQVIHFYGDGSLTLYGSAVEAVQCAIDIQRTLQEGTAVPVRIGVHLGEVVRQGDTIYGNAVNIASRLHNLGTPASILVSGSVAEQLVNHNELELQYIGTESVKNIREPVKVYAVKADGLAVPTWHEIRKRNKARRTSIVWPTIFVLSLVAVAILQFVVDHDGPPDFLDERIAVLPFTNNTGDTSLNYLGAMASDHISKCLEETENALTVRYDRMARSYQDVQRFGLLPSQSIARMVGAQNIIEGSYSFNDDSTIQIESHLIDGKSLEYIEYFPNVVVPVANATRGIRELGQRIAGYWLSKDAQPVGFPLKDAYKAYLQALETWHSDYDKSISFLERSIEIDSTFLEAYFMLFNAYANQYQYEDALKVIETIEQRFNLEKLKERELDWFKFYQAQARFENEAAYQHLRTLYRKDSAELLINTDMAVKALEFVNEPAQCLQILEVIPFDSIDFELNVYARDRITLGINAAFTLGQYARAEKYSQYYPRNDESRIQLRLRARALAGIRDTAGISRMLTRLRVMEKETELRRVLYQLSRDFRLMGLLSLSHYYNNWAMREYENVKSVLPGHLLYDSGEIEAGLEHFQELHQEYGDHPLVLYGLGRGVALQNDTAKAIAYINLIGSKKPERFDFGETEYSQAKIYTFLGYHEEGIIKLDQAIEDGFFFTENAMQNDPDLKPLFNDPEFQAVIHPLRS